jgi:hypothetical protein
LRIRVASALSLETIYHPGKVREFRFQRYVPEYYTGSKDFTHSEVYTVFYTRFEYIITRKRQRTDYSLYGGNLFDSDTAYFIRNAQICDGQVMIANVFDDMEVAIRKACGFLDSGSLEGIPQGEWYGVQIFWTADGDNYLKENFIYNFKTGEFFEGEYGEKSVCVAAITANDGSSKWVALLRN